MKIEVAEDRSIILKEVYSGVGLVTSEGNEIGICMRDDTFEINVMPKDCTPVSIWYRVNMQDLTMEEMRVDATTVKNPEGEVSNGTV
jgi:hypothetical protein